MKSHSLILFDSSRCVELPLQILPCELPLHQDFFQDFLPNQPLNEQIDLPLETMVSLENDLRIFRTSEEENFYSIRNIFPVRIGSSSKDHIQMLNNNAALVIQEESIFVLEDTDVYMNGEKVSTGEYPLVSGDCVWVGMTRVIIHEDYVAVAGTGHSVHLNLSTFTPERYEDFPDYKRSPRIIKREPTASIDLNSPPAKPEHKKGELVKLIVPTLVTMAVTVGSSMLMGRGIFVLVSAAATLLSMVFSVTTFFNDKKEKAAKEKAREDAYDKYLLSRRKEVHSLYESQKDSLCYHNLSPKEIEKEIHSYSSRLYERSSNDSDFLTVSLGTSTVPSSYKLKYKADTDATEKDPLLEEMQNLGEKYQTIPQMPTVIDLKAAHLGLVGEKPYIHRQLNSILTQLCFFQSYHDIEIVLLVDEEDREKFEWVRWYPHCRLKSINVIGLVSAENQRDQVLGNMAQMLKMRRQKQQEEKKDSRFLPQYIFIVDNPKLIINHSIMEYLQTPETSLGFSLIYTTHIRANLPENIRTVFLLDGGDRGTLLLNEGNLLNRSVILPTIDGIDLETMSRKLAPIRHQQGISTQIPENVSFFELYGVKKPEEIPILELWNRNACHKSLAVPLGLRGKDDIVALNLHEKAHGPHGLVAGTTGSGKSEIVQSYILSLAVNFHPHEVGFLLIDYKGGGMANLFQNLPHLLGTITNLDGSESMRALASIKSELARRQRVFNDSGVNNINQYTKLFKDGEVTLPLPHLFIISDEFAELKKEQPEFMSELVSAARIGRSLGVHLILATQKPSGVVDDQIWSNSKFKLALKVANESDSNEVLKTPDAARITQPGRAYLQVGNNEIYELFQSAWSGAPYSEAIVEQGFDSRVYEINQLGQGVLLNEDLSTVDKTQDSKLTQLDVLVNHIQKLYESLSATVVEKPWLPPLSEKIVTSHLKSGEDVGKIESYDLVLPIGMVDIPEAQKQEEYTHNFYDDGNLAIFGASGFGKSTTAMNAALSLASRNSPSLLNYFILDYGNSALAQLRSLPHTADYLGFDDAEKLLKLMKLLFNEIKQRKQLFASANALNFRMYNEVSPEKLPAIIIFIDNYDVTREVSADLEEFLIKLTRDGVGIGMYTIITASRPSIVRYSVLNNFKNKIAHFMLESSDFTSAVGRSTYKLPELHGRALVKLKDVHVAQCYLPVEFKDDISYAKLVGDTISQIELLNTAPCAQGIRLVPEVVTFADLTSYFQIGEKQAVVGFDVESTEPQYLDLRIGSQMIVGSPTTGKTNILKILLEQFKDFTCYVADSRAGDLQDYAERQNVIYMSTESHFIDFYQKLSEEVEKRYQAFNESGLRSRDFGAAQAPTLVLIDDGDNFIDLVKTKAQEMESLVPRAFEVGFSFFVTSLPTKMRGYDNLTKLLRDNQGGLVLGNPSEQSIFSVTAPRAYKPVPEIGFWYKRGDIKQIKIPFIS